MEEWEVHWEIWWFIHSVFHWEVQRSCGSVLFSYIVPNSDLKQHKFILLQLWRSEVQNVSHRAKTKVLVRLHFFMEAVGENPFPCLFQLLKVPAFHSSWHLPHLQSQQRPVESFSHFATWTLTLLPPSFTSQDPCEYIGPPG